MSFHKEILDTYISGQNPQESYPSNVKKRTRRSKLQSESKLILEIWASGRSLQFICNQLRKKSITCHRSTISRFISKSTNI